MTPLTVQPWPTWAAVSEAGQAHWAQALAALRARALVATAADVQLAAVAHWAATVRQAGRVAVLRAPVQAIDQAWLRAVDGSPLVLALAPTTTSDRRAWQRAFGALARCRSPWLRVDTANLPWCALSGWSVLGEVAIAWPAAGRRTDDRCHSCAAVERCPGPGGPRLLPRPLPVPISNQFDLEPTEVQGPDRVQVQGEPPLAVAQGSAPRAAVARALARGQLYRDQSDRALVDDFAAQLQPLRRDRAGQWVPRKAAPFAAEEDRLLALLTTLRGVVVDVGAGPLRYVSALNQALNSGQLRYVAVEPDLSCLRVGRAAVPNGHFVRGVGEALPLADGCADAVLYLRSWNHLRDVGAAVREATRVVRPGGLLVAVDNELFGLVRSASQLARARAVDTASTPFEHYRNASLPQAWLAIARAAPGRWRKTGAWPVGPQTSNQWQLIAQRVPD